MKNGQQPASCSQVTGEGAALGGASVFQAGGDLPLWPHQQGPVYHVCTDPGLPCSPGADAHSPPRPSSLPLPLPPSSFPRGRRDQGVPR